MKHSPPKKMTFISKVSVQCRCGKKVSFGEDSEGTPCGIHESPHCKEFARMELIEYMRWLRGDA